MPKVLGEKTLSDGTVVSIIPCGGCGQEGGMFVKGSDRERRFRKSKVNHIRCNYCLRTEPW